MNPGVPRDLIGQALTPYENNGPHPFFFMLATKKVEIQGALSVRRNKPSPRPSKSSCIMCRSTISSPRRRKAQFGSRKIIFHHSLAQPDSELAVSFSIKPPVWFTPAISRPLFILGLSFAGPPPLLSAYGPDPNTLLRLWGRVALLEDSRKTMGLKHAETPNSFMLIAQTRTCERTCRITLGYRLNYAAMTHVPGHGKVGSVVTNEPCKLPEVCLW